MALSPLLLLGFRRPFPVSHAVGFCVALHESHKSAPVILLLNHKFALHSPEVVPVWTPHNQPDTIGLHFNLTFLIAEPNGFGKTLGVAFELFGGFEPFEPQGYDTIAVAAIALQTDII